MCFSSSASFAASGLLIILAGKALRLVRDKSPRYLFIATIPLLFSLQQFCEGEIWYYIDEYKSYTTICARLFLFFALIIWPTWIPLTFFAIEQEKKRKQVLGLLLFCGLIFSGNLMYVLLNYPVDAQIVNCHMVYSIAMSTTYSTLLMIALYCIPVLTPFFISSMKQIWIMGLLVAASLVGTYVVWYEALTSIWCFFAALISSSIVYFLWKK